jgi:hypothetical protein
MASLVLSGDTSGSITVSAPAVSGSNTQTLAAVTGTLAPVVSGTAQTAPFTDNTRAEFTGIPSWAKRITVMFNVVSTSSTSNLLVQIGSGSFATTNYASAAFSIDGTNATGVSVSTAGFLVARVVTAAATFNGLISICLISGNSWVESGNLINSTTTGFGTTSTGSITLGGALDRVRVTTVNGTDTFDTGSIINILYE